MKKLLLGAMMAALFMSGDAEGGGLPLFGKKSALLKEAKKAQNTSDTDIFEQQGVLRIGHRGKLTKILEILSGIATSLTKIKKPDTDTKYYKNLVQANIDFLKKIISNSKNSMNLKRKTDYAKIIESINIEGNKVVLQLNHFTGHILNSLIVKNLTTEESQDVLKGWADDFDKIIDLFDQTKPTDRTKFLLDKYCTALRDLDTKLALTVYNNTGYRSDTRQRWNSERARRQAYNRQATDLSKKRKYGYGVPANGQMSQNIRAGANQYNDMIRRNSSPYNNEYSGSTSKIPPAPAQHVAVYDADGSFNSYVDASKVANDHTLTPMYNNSGTLVGYKKMSPTLLKRTDSGFFESNIPPAPGEIEYVNGRFIKKN